MFVKPEISRAPDGRSTFKLPAEIAKNLDPYAAEALTQAAWFDHAETKVFHDPGAFPATSVRGFMGKCLLTSEERSFSVYPIIRVFSTGIIEVTFRLMSPDGTVSIAEFINEYWSASSHAFDEVLTPTGLVRTQMRQDVESTTARQRVPILKRRRIRKKLLQFIESQTTTLVDDDFSFEVSPIFRKGLQPTLSNSGEAVLAPGPDDRTGYSLSDLAQTIVGATSYVLGKRQLLSRRTRCLRLGNQWMGRPHIHITGFPDQQETATENRAVHQAAFGCIIAGAMADNESQAVGYLPASSRSFEDYGLYIGEAASLAVWSRIGLSRRSLYAAANRAHLIYEIEVVQDALDYGHLLHGKVLELARSASSSAEAYAVWEELLKLQLSLRRLSPFGELQDLFKEGWIKMGVDELRLVINDVLRIQSEASKNAEARKADSWRFAVTSVLGIIAALGVADQVVRPAWGWLSLWTPARPAAANLLLVGVAFVSVCALLLITRAFLGLWRYLTKRSRL